MSFRSFDLLNLVRDFGEDLTLRKKLLRVVLTTLLLVRLMGQALLTTPPLGTSITTTQVFLVTLTQS